MSVLRVVGTVDIEGHLIYAMLFVASPEPTCILSLATWSGGDWSESIGVENNTKMRGAYLDKLHFERVATVQDLDDIVRSLGGSIDQMVDDRRIPCPARIALQVAYDGVVRARGRCVSSIRAIQAERGWTDETLLGLLLEHASERMSIALEGK